MGALFVDRARYLRQPDERGDEVAWATRFTVGVAAMGCLWGLTASVVLLSPDPIAHVMVTFVLGGTVGAFFQHSAYLPAFFSFALPAAVPQVVCYLAKGDRISIAMGLMLAVYVVIVALMGRYLNRWIVETARLRLDQAAVNSKLQAAVAESKAVLNEIEQIYRYAPVALCFIDTNYRYVRINEQMAKMHGLPVSAHIGRTLREIVPGIADELMEIFRPVLERGEPVLNVELIGQLANYFPFRSESGEVTGLIGAVTDITDLKQAQLALQQSEERFHTIFNSVNDLIFVRDFETGALVEVNQRVCEMFGYTRDELLKLDIGDLSENKPPYTGQNLLSEMQKARSGTPQTFDWRGKTKDGRLFWAEISMRRATFGGRDFLLSTAREISRRKEAEGQLKRMAQFDLLTGLANRGVFVAEVVRAIERARRGERSFAILYLDLDHFKDVNDTLGHPIGDRLLQSVAERLQANVRAIDTLARFGGDEFALLMADIGDPTDAGVLADKLLQIMVKPFLLDGNQIQSGVSIGIATYEPDAPDAEALLAHADVALYRAKSEGRHTYRFFTGAMDAEVRERVTLTSELQAGIAAGQLFLAYQPQVDMETSQLVGLEALVRWNHPTRGVLLPGEFLPAAERSGLIVMLGNWVLRSACRQAQQWLEIGVALPPVAINVSALQFKAPRELENEIEAALAETGTSARIVGNRDDGNRADGNFERARQRRRAAARPRTEDRDRRFRHGLFVVALSSALSGRSDQNRAGIRQGYRRRSPTTRRSSRRRSAWRASWESESWPRAWKRQTRCDCCTSGDADRPRDSTLPRQCRRKRFCRSCAAAASCIGWQGRRSLPAGRGAWGLSSHDASIPLPKKACRIETQIAGFLTAPRPPRPLRARKQTSVLSLYSSHYAPQGVDDAAARTL